MEAARRSHTSRKWTSWLNGMHSLLYVTSLNTASHDAPNPLIATMIGHPSSTAHHGLLNLHQPPLRHSNDHLLLELHVPSVLLYCYHPREHFRFPTGFPRVCNDAGLFQVSDKSWNTLLTSE